MLLTLAKSGNYSIVQNAVLYIYFWKDLGRLSELQLLRFLLSTYNIFLSEDKKMKLKNAKSHDSFQESVHFKTCTK